MHRALPVSPVALGQKVSEATKVDEASKANPALKDRSERKVSRARPESLVDPVSRGGRAMWASLASPAGLASRAEWDRREFLTRNLPSRESRGRSDHKEKMVGLTKSLSQSIYV